MSRSAILTVLMFCYIVSVGQNISVTFSGTGAVTQIDRVTATNLRTNQSVTLPGNETLVLTVNTGIQSVSELTNQGIVFPNPFSGRATFTTVVQKSQTVYLDVRNLVGQVVAETQAFVQPGENLFDLSLATAGIYMVNLTTEEAKSSYKIICTGATTVGNSIQYLGTVSNSHNTQNNQNDQNSPPGSAFKSLNSGYTLGYIAGDVILYRCRSGIYTSMLTDSPASSKNYEIVFAACTDTDGKNYSIVKIGTQTWMAENLAYLPAVSPSSAISNTTPNYYVYGYEGNSVSSAKGKANYGIYGVLYNWEAGKTACPSGWQLPSDEDWMILEKNLGMSDDEAGYWEFRYSGSVGGKLKETGTLTWSLPNKGATNESGFTALPGGELDYDGGGFKNLGIFANFWSASEMGSLDAWCRGLWSDKDGVERDVTFKGYGFSVRCLKTQAASLPVVSTSEITGIAASYATGGGNIINDGGAFITARGVCWNITGTPTISNDKTTECYKTRAFTSSLNRLTLGTRYFVRAYATNYVGTAYGEQKEFATLTGGDDDIFTDSRDGRGYSYKIIGTQTWMTENLAYLPSVSPSSAGSETTPYYYVYGYEGTSVNIAKFTDNYTLYGVLYNCVAAKTACPSGWHLPSASEWSTLIDTLGTSAGGKMKETGSIHWSCPNVGAINTSGFSALPSGICEPRDGGDGRFAGLNFSAHFWSTDSHSPDLSSYDDKVQMFNWDGYNGFSVRCLKGDSPLATVTTTDITGITETSASGGGNVTSDGGYVVTAKGVCWNSNETPTTSDSKTINGIGTGVFTSSISGLTAGRPYNVRAYATNSVGTAYGVAKQFTTTGGGGAFTDPRDGHNYPYKTIGIQTWMTENLAYLLAVSPSSAGSETNPYYYVLGYEGSTVASAKATANYSTYGVLYNWEAAKTACPSGWHLPTDDEWKILEKNQGMSETDANTGGWRDSGAVGGKLKETGTTHWWNPNTGATNSSGFTALPGGYRYNSGAFSLLGLYAYFWSSSECGSTALYRYLDYYFDGVYQDCRYRSYGFSVRCLRN